MFELSDKEAQEMLKDYLFFKLYVGATCLQKIPKTIPQERNFDYLQMESDIETFLYFMVSAQDILINEIAKFFNIKMKSADKLGNIMDGLESNFDASALSIVQELKKYFSEPYRDLREYHKDEVNDHLNTPISETEFKELGDFYYQPYWNVERSRLLILRKMRNKITHESLVTLNSYISGAKSLTITLENDPVKIYRGIFEIFNPFNFFLKTLEDMNKAVNSIRKILNETR